MEKTNGNVKIIDHIFEYEEMVGAPSRHPLVSVIDFSRCHEIDRVEAMSFGFYAVFLKDVDCGNMRYGRKHYDYQKGTLVFVAPGQVLEIDGTGRRIQPHGYGLLFDPSMLHGTSLGKAMQQFSFFGYAANEAVHLSEEERSIFMDCLAGVERELQHGVDRLTKRITASAIELTLSHCLRFYDRQFITREDANDDLLTRFESFVREYYQDERAGKEGVLSVAQCADHLNLTPNYLGDLIKKETGRTPQEHLQMRIMNIAKDLLLDESLTISEVAYALGFQYAQHFTRAFKQATGLSPKEYRLKQLN